MEPVSRRLFLGAAAATTAKAYTRIIGANDRLRIGVIGCGGMATGHMRGLVRNKEAFNSEIVAVCDLWDKRLTKAAELTGGKPIKNYKDLLADKDIDYVLNATPEHQHAHIIIDALHAGKHVYTEKPMTRTTDQAKAVVAAVKATGLKLQVGVQGTSDDSFITANKYIRDGAIGKPVLAQIDYSRNHIGDFFFWEHDADIEPGRNLDWNTWQGYTKKRAFKPDLFFSWRRYWDYSGGISGDLFVHRVTRLIKAMGLTFPDKACAAGGKNEFKDSVAEIPDTMCTLLDYPEGTTIQLISSMANDTPIPHLIRGHKGTIEFTRTGFTLTPQKDFSSDKQEIVHVKSGAEDIMLHHKNLQAAIRTGAELNCDCNLGYYGVVASEMGVASLRKRKYVAWDKAKERIVSL